MDLDAVGIVNKYHELKKKAEVVGLTLITTKTGFRVSALLWIGPARLATMREIEIFLNGYERGCKASISEHPNANGSED